VLPLCLKITSKVSGSGQLQDDANACIGSLQLLIVARKSLTEQDEAFLEVDHGCGARLLSSAEKHIDEAFDGERGNMEGSCVSCTQVYPTTVVHLVAYRCYERIHNLLRYR